MYIIFVRLFFVAATMTINFTVHVYMHRHAFVIVILLFDILYIIIYTHTLQIMLGLVSHEPHFSLLREEVRFGKKAQKRLTTPDTVTFHLLHLSIMREYLDFEFGTLKVKCGRKREGGRERGGDRKERRRVCI